MNIVENVGFDHSLAVEKDCVHSIAIKHFKIHVKLLDVCIHVIPKI